LKRKVFWRSRGVACIVFFLVLIPPASWAGPAGQSLVVKKPAILDTCPELIDPELDTKCGRYATYYFGMDVIIDCTGSGAFFTMRPHPNMPPETVVSPTGISFKDPQVSYLAGIGRNSIYQAVQVTGDNKIVTGLVNLDISIPRSMITRPSDLGLGKGSLSGVKY
jgi:hypothetical protein